MSSKGKTIVIDTEAHEILRERAYKENRPIKEIASQSIKEAGKEKPAAPPKPTGT